MNSSIPSQAYNRDSSARNVALIEQSPVLEEGIFLEHESGQESTQEPLKRTHKYTLERTGSIPAAVERKQPP
jgi:hypothetical protein